MLTRFRIWWRGLSRNSRLGVKCIPLIAGIALLALMSDNSSAERRAEYRATFLAQCHAAGDSDDQCTFFLTIIELDGGAAARQATFNAATTPK